MPFTPFDDTQTPQVEPDPTRNGYDTSGWDIYRQGVEITRNKFLFLGTQPKFWNGNFTGEVVITTYGQPQGSVEEDPLGLESKFVDLPRIDPVSLISMGDTYPTPIELNGGPQDQSEAVIEPLTIPFRKRTNEGPFYAHAVRGSLEDGNDLDNFIVRSNSRIEQFMELGPPLSPRPFLDEGGGYFGPVRINQYVSSVERRITPFDDTQTYRLEKQLHTSVEDLRAAIRRGDQEDSGLLPYGKRSATAGWDCYGLNAGQQGTDSITFNGWARGS